MGFWYCLSEGLFKASTESFPAYSNQLKRTDLPVDCADKVAKREVVKISNTIDLIIKVLKL
jgi:hypothetical protein